MILYGKPVKEYKLKQIKSDLDGLGFTPTLSIIVANGFNQASTTYVNNKIKLCEELGINYELINLEWEGKTREEVLDDLKYIINTLNNCKECNGYLIQMLLPHNIQEHEFSHLIDYKKDVDGFSPINLGRLYKGLDSVIPCTAQATIDLIDYYGIDLEGKDVLLINRSQLIGIPSIPLLLNKNATVQVAHSKTKNIDDKILKSDIIISATGIPKFLNKSNIRVNHTIIDVSINRDENGNLCGDIDKSLYEILNGSPRLCYSPVGGGVGLLTVTNVIANLIKCCKLQAEGK